MKQLFQSLSSTDDGAFIIDGRHRIIFWNQAAEKLLGYTSQEVMGRQCYEILGGRDEQGQTLCQRFCRVAIQAQRGDLLPNQDIWAHTKHGDGRWLNVSTFVYPVKEKPLEPIIVHLFRDTTTKRSYQQFVSQILSASERLQQNDRPPGTLSAPVGATIDILTPREAQVLVHLAHGASTNEIAATLVISPSTVRNHVQNILGKLGVHSRLEAISYAFQNGLIENGES